MAMSECNWQQLKYAWSENYVVAFVYYVLIFNFFKRQGLKKTQQI